MLQRQSFLNWNFCASFVYDEGTESDQSQDDCLSRLSRLVSSKNWTRKRWMIQSQYIKSGWNILKFRPKKWFNNWIFLKEYPIEKGIANLFQEEYMQPFVELLFKFSLQITKLMEHSTFIFCECSFIFILNAIIALVMLGILWHVFFDSITSLCLLAKLQTWLASLRRIAIKMLMRKKIEARTILNNILTSSWASWKMPSTIINPIRNNMLRWFLLFEEKKSIIHMCNLN
jgi:hypothetical protein